jgi:hypothetical protein
MNEIIDRPEWAQLGGRRSTERVGYYRLRSGWITASDTQASKMQVMMLKGATFLGQYPSVEDSNDYWGPILRSPGGPEEFPVDQVLTYRWYRQDTGGRCLHSRSGLTRHCPVKDVRFPQLAGVKITEFPCPEGCNDKAYHSPLHLGSHLRIMHGYDRSEILKYGEAMNIDFTKIPGGKEVIEYDFTKAEIAAKEVEDLAVEVVSAAAPASAETAAGFGSIEVLQCSDCDYTTEGKMKHQFALGAHRRAKHSPVAVPA